MRLARIDIFYSYNTAEILTSNGDWRLPKTPVEVLSMFCETAIVAPQADLTLLGAKAAGCVRAREGRVDVTIGVPYARDGVELDSLVVVSLRTTERRFQRDLRVFRRVAAGVGVCATSRSRSACAADAHW